MDGWLSPLPDLKAGIVVNQSFYFMKMQFRRVRCEWILVSYSYSTKVESIS